jgi:hypothetical protein
MLAISAVGLAAGSASAASDLTLETTAGIPGHSGIGYDDQPATQTLLEHPQGITTDSSGDVFVADTGAHVVREITPDGIARVVAGVPGVAGSDADGRAATSSHLTAPTGLLVMPDGLLIADPGAHRVVLLHDGVLSAFAGTGVSGTPTRGSDATGTPFRAPTGLATDGAGSVFVSDADDDTVWKITSGGAVVTQSTLSDPTGLAWVSGHLVIADTGNQRVRTVSSTGYLGELLGPSAVSAPTGLLQGSGSQLYIADAVGRVGVQAGSGVTWYAGTDNSGFSPDGTPADQASLSDPTAVAFSANGRLLIAETGSSAIRDLRVTANAPYQPAAPVGTPGDGSIAVRWRPGNDGGSPITSWILQAYAGGALVDQVSVAGGGDATTLTGLTDGTAYTLTITAINAYGSSPASVSSNPLVPSAPGTLTTVGTGTTGGGVGGAGGGGHGGTTILTFGSGSTPTPTAPPSASTTYLHLAAPSGIAVQPEPTPTGAPQYDGTRPVLVPSVVPAAHPTTSASAAATALSPVQSVPLLPVRSFADAATDVATVGKKSVVPLVLVGLLAAFLVLQGVVDRRDPKLAEAPLLADRGLEFGPA